MAATAQTTQTSAFTRLDAPASATGNAAWTAALQATANNAAASGTGAVHMTATGISDTSPATVALHNLQQQARLAAAGGVGTNIQSQSTQPVVTKPTWFRSQWFIQPITAIGVFLLCFILLIAIRPPFLYKKQPPDAAGNAVDEEPVFSTGGAAVFALCAMLLAVVCMVVFAVIQRKKQQPKIAR